MNYGKRDNCTNYHTFSFHEKDYPLNTVVKIKDGMFSPSFKPLYNYPMVQVVEHFLDKNGKTRWTYAMWKYNGAIWHYTTTESPDELVERIEQLAPPEPTQDKKSEYYKDSEVPGMGAAWAIYIAVMIFSPIFRGFLAVWVIGSFIFFSWRKEKLRKPVKYKYGFDMYKMVEKWHKRSS